MPAGGWKQDRDSVGWDGVCEEDETDEAGKENKRK